MQAALAAAPGIRAARDCTRGGLASSLNEIAAEAGVGIEIDETLLPLRDEVRGVCEILGLDPLYLANEGTLVLFCPPDQAEAALAAMRGLPEGAGAALIGQAVAAPAGREQVPGDFRVMEWMPPSLTALQCAKLEMLQFKRMEGGIHEGS
jgi:hydrogenase expression/formation protein HypE